MPALSSYRVLVAGLGLVLCGLATACADPTPQTGKSGRGNLEPVFADDSFRSAVLDTQNVIIPPYAAARRVIGETDVWAVDYLWFFFHEKPGEAFRLSMLKKLEEAGVVQESTIIRYAPYRVRIEASYENLVDAVREQHPPATPPGIIEAVRRATLD